MPNLNAAVFANKRTDTPKKVMASALLQKGEWN
jgi:hypothetical protein